MTFATIAKHKFNLNSRKSPYYPKSPDLFVFLFGGLALFLPFGNGIFVAIG